MTQLQRRSERSRNQCTQATSRLMAYVHGSPANIIRPTRATVCAVARYRSVIRSDASRVLCVYARRALDDATHERVTAQMLISIGRSRRYYKSRARGGRTQRPLSFRFQNATFALHDETFSLGVLHSARVGRRIGHFRSHNKKRAAAKCYPAPWRILFDGVGRPRNRDRARSYSGFFCA